MTNDKPSPRDDNLSPRDRFARKVHNHARYAKRMRRIDPHWRDAGHRRAEGILYAWGDFDFSHQYGYPGISLGDHSSRDHTQLSRLERDAQKIGKVMIIHQLISSAPEQIQLVAAAKYREKLTSARLIASSTGLDRRAVVELLDVLIQMVLARVGPDKPQQLGTAEGLTSGPQPA